MLYHEESPIKPSPSQPLTWIVTPKMKEKPIFSAACIQLSGSLLGTINHSPRMSRPTTHNLVEDVTQEIICGGLRWAAAVEGSWRNIISRQFGSLKWHGGNLPCTPNYFFLDEFIANASSTKKSVNLRPGDEKWLYYRVLQGHGITKHCSRTKIDKHLCTLC